MPTPVAPAARDRLRIAIQKSGRLAEPSRALLMAAGLTWRESRDRLFCYGEALPVDLLLVRDDDIPGLLDSGVCDLGVVGRNLLAEHGQDRWRELRALGFGECRLAIAIPDGDVWRDATQLRGARIATSYPAILASWLRDQDVEADVLALSGSVEIAPSLGRADAICDLVSTGATLVANQLKAVATVLQSEAVLAAPSTACAGARAELITLLLQRIDGVLRQRESRLLLCQAESAALPGLLRLLGDGEAPSLMRLDGGSGFAVQALCRGDFGWQRLEELKRAGARGLMVLPVERVLA